MGQSLRGRSFRFDTGGGLELYSAFDYVQLVRMTLDRESPSQGRSFRFEHWMWPTRPLLCVWRLGDQTSCRRAPYDCGRPAILLQRAQSECKVRCLQKASARCARACTASDPRAQAALPAPAQATFPAAAPLHAAITLRARWLTRRALHWPTVAGASAADGVRARRADRRSPRRGGGDPAHV